MLGVAVGVHYCEGDNLRFLKDILIENKKYFIKVELWNYIVTILKKQIIKIETSKKFRRGTDENTTGE